MAIDIFPKLWSVIPPVTARAVQGHPLCPRFGFVFNGAIVDLVTGITAPGGPDGVFSSSSARGYAGAAREHANTSHYDRIPVDANVLLPATAEVTFVLGYQKTDGTNRASSAIGGENNSTAPYIVHVPLPF